MTKFILGTAQFGKSYGISNLKKKSAKEKINQIVRVCKKNKIDLVDISEHYFTNSVKLNLNKNFKKKIYKFSGFKKNNFKLKINEIIKKEKTMYCLMLHNPDDLKKSFIYDLKKLIVSLKQRKYIKKIGVSVYTEQQFWRASNVFGKHLGVVQAPINLVDQRFLNKKFLDFCEINKIEIHARSIFLQGLLLMKKRPNYFKQWSNLFSSWDKIQSISERISICLNFIKLQKNIHKVILGVLDEKQLIKIINLYKKNNDINKYLNLNSKDKKLIIPSNWKI